jgi:uncharacterized protein (TIGR03083 family)
MSDVPVPPPPADALRAAYFAFSEVVATIDDERSWLPTGCTGWSVRDLIFHCLTDAQRGLVALHTPAHQAPDRDAVTYWQDHQPSDVGAANGRRFTRVVASMFLKVDQLRELYLETAAAVVTAAAVTVPEESLATQGHVLTAGDLMRTLAVEVTIHHLDITVSLDDGADPSPEGLLQVRQTLDGLLGHPGPVSWGHAHYARVVTGRVALSSEERKQLGAAAARLPLLG